MQPMATHLEIAKEDDFVVFGEGVEDKQDTDANEAGDGNLQAKVYLATLHKSHQVYCNPWSLQQCVELLTSGENK